MRVLVAMSGGVDSSVAAAILLEEGHEVVGATMKLWGGRTDSGCCTVADVEDARRVADQLGIVHRVFNFTKEFEASVVDPYVSSHAAGRTPNPCVECNRHLKFGRLLARAETLGFDAVATGHHARVEEGGGRSRLLRGADAAKDQSYVLSVLGQRQLRRTLLPIGDLTKSDVRRRAADLGLRTAAKPDSQDVCFIASPGGRERFLSSRIRLRPARVVDGNEVVGRVPAMELVTLGQRRGLGLSGGGTRRYAVSVDQAAATIRVGPESELLASRVDLVSVSWTDRPVPPGETVEVQSSAHGSAAPAVLDGAGARFDCPRRRVSPGQTVAIYRGDTVLGAGTAVAGPS